MQRRIFVTSSLSAASALVAVTAIAGLQPAMAADAAWPSPDQPIRLVVPFPPGGTADVVNRLFAQQLGQVLKTTVIVENKAGAGGSVGTRQVADARPDGYTLLGATSSTHGTNPAVYTKLPYDPVKDFTPITQVITVPGVLSVHPSVKASNIKELIALSKAQPGQLSYASAGAGGLGHLAMELFKARAGIELMHIPYRGAGPAFTDLIGGQVSMLWEPLPASLPHIKSGKIRPLAVATAQRSSELPDVPTFAELGVPGYAVQAWNGLLAPKGLPRDIRDKLHKASVQALADPQLRQRLAELGGTVIANAPNEFAAIIENDVATWKRVAATSRISLD
ncbi:tripartite tricarboxylate transporter substrate binding protein BugE [Pantoea sp. 18069]|uniref:tripartite tricarboxylate transporter substrate binding protein BugE n=1 Tax=Pantoea sp. 18069 TaxID=2681415 RepID=UPI00135B2DC2|nr:tripartite tricarboxylate transporter substrate binding protein BugE [Pantoea sp. 18069]